ncbi:adenylyltransferase and sulfurtransferase MOCS3 isoform X4 [Manduca sexta]|uniref:adenylyltransferase and sulfurtransferase MOCS3 isoform X4 n=1 Tax=Manduca sexta TaxID=7130 RepID=UPI00188DF015|nr:adenylyltransferase and sulfurtransferase MOCS3 isoform X4 [Manduca sexta]
MDRVSVLEQEIADLRKMLHEKETELYQIKNGWVMRQLTTPVEPERQNYNNSGVQYSGNLPKWAIERYSRQILLPDIGVAGQEKLCKARVLIVGAGGLGCPASVYLAGSGVGEIGIVDYDTVDVTNIHRQILHYEKDEHVSKAESAAQTLRSINSRIKVTPYSIQLDSTNAMQIAANYDIILDCSDNVPTRYLLNDLSVMLKIPLISGSALQMEGQLTIYGYRANNNPKEMNGNYTGPCYRCVFPTPPPPEAVGSCSTNGVAGPIPGVIGALQALEAIKYIVGHSHSGLLVERMLLFDGDDTTFRTVKLRPRNSECAACSDTPSICQLLDYETVCKTQAKEKDLDLHILPPENRTLPTDLAGVLNKTDQRHLLIDVRSEPEFLMCRIDGAVNYPIEKIDGVLEKLVGEIEECDQVTFICRRGNDSQIAAKKVLDVIGEEHSRKIKDLTGGLHAWSKHVDRQFPVY